MFIGVVHELLQEHAHQPYLHRVQRHVHVDEHGVVVGKIASPGFDELQEHLGRDERVVLNELREHLRREARVEDERGVPL